HVTAIPSCPLVLFFTPPPPPGTSPLSLHDALPISRRPRRSARRGANRRAARHHGWDTIRTSPRLGLTWRTSAMRRESIDEVVARSEEHTSELQSLAYLVCRLLLEKKKKTRKTIQNT